MKQPNNITVVAAHIARMVGGPKPTPAEWIGLDRRLKAAAQCGVSLAGVFVELGRRHGVNGDAVGPHLQAASRRLDVAGNSPLSSIIAARRAA
jgi:hypothetical protein